ncbi:crotonase/enoyl-CoA hydratase family protein [Pseudonocardia halophobica]|uniref:Enoyl-CoA hydratase n=1 Tax=Pseudonocardia halophobica TaxID=29401 RepID=A0A9W6L3L9_9PSEU|nr:crotonase/enoyl-CoA hydratase family protein [Pseudonocardia halophobica]GLL11644.1 enoyl-CoA hydratase [Pseudonocardia halophobica]
MEFETLTVEAKDGVAQLRLDRPAQANALNRTLWSELRTAVDALDADPTVRVVVIAGNGKHFCAGIDLEMLGSLRAGADCAGRAAEALRRTILDLQDVITSVERCRVPVIAAVHGACVGAGMDLATACDLRYSTEDARFVVKEIDMAVVADVGVLQRLPRIVGEGVTRELAYTGRTVSGGEALGLRLVNGVYPDAEALATGVAELAASLAAKPPLALRGTKHAITYARDHTVADALDQVATWNAGTLISADLDEALAAAKERRPAVYRD